MRCKGAKHGPAPIPQEGRWTEAKQISTSRLHPRCGLCAPQQGAYKLTLNVREGIIQEALVETSAVREAHSAAMAAEILPARLFLRLSTRTLSAMRSMSVRAFLRWRPRREPGAFSGRASLGAGLEDLERDCAPGRDHVRTLPKGVRYLKWRRATSLNLPWTRTMRS